MGFPSGSEIKNPPVMQEIKEMQVRSLGGEDPLEKEMATHSSTLAWKIPWSEEPARLQSVWSNGNTFQYSCLENPMDRGAWQATVHRIAQSQI